MGEGNSHQLEAYFDQVKCFGRAGKVDSSVHVVKYKLSSTVCRLDCRRGLSSCPLGGLFVNPLEDWTGRKRER